MLKLLLLLSCIVLSSMKNYHESYLIIFTSEGTYYKLMLASKKVEWYKSLGSSLLSFELSNDKQQDIASSYIIPTLDGHFMYIDAQSQILIKRQEVQQLLHVCLQGNKHIQSVEPAIEYFIYEKFEYYIINLKNGAAEDIETALKNGMPSKMDAMAVLKITKKYLKQLKKDLTVAWSTISSDLQLIPAPLFLQNPKKQSMRQPSESKYSFRRVGSTEVQMIADSEEMFQIGGKSHILSIFEFINSEKGFLKHALKFYHKPTLALDYVRHPKQDKVKDLIESERLKNEGHFFVHSEQIKKKEDSPPNHVENCINIFRTFQAITDESNKQNIHIKPEGSNFIYSTLQQMNNSLSFRSYERNVEPIVINYGPTESQPYLWIALIFMMAVVFYGLYRMKINTLENEISVIESKTGERLEEFQRKLGQMEDLKKMYEVYWDKIIYQVAGDQWFQHFVFEGKFLNQQAMVYAVRLQGTDVVTLQHKLNTLLNFSHPGLCKLYYYTKNAELLLIFTEKLSPLRLKKLPQDLQVSVPAPVKKNLITQILSAVAYLDAKIEVNSLPHQAISIDPILVPEGEPYYEYKLNPVPCLLKRSLDDSDYEESRSASADSSTYQLRLNLLTIFNLIIQQGKPFDKEKLDEHLKNEAYSQEQYLQFFDFILYEARSKNQKQIDSGTSQSSREIMFKDILDHPYLWDSKRKILFLSDFSNYIETHIDQSKVKKLESHAKDYNVIKTPWIKEFHFTFVREVSNYRKYDYESVRDLIRVIRNKLNHFHQIPKDVKINIGKTPEGFIQYCLELFPKLLHFAFVYTRKKKWKLHMK